MFKPAVDDETIIQPRPVAKAITAPSQGTQGLVDAHGKRSTDISGSMLLNRSRDTSKKPEPVTLSAADKPWLPVAIGSSVVILLIIALSLFF